MVSSYNSKNVTILGHPRLQFLAIRVGKNAAVLRQSIWHVWNKIDWTSILNDVVGIYISHYFLLIRKFFFFVCLFVCLFVFLFLFCFVLIMSSCPRSLHSHLLKPFFYMIKKSRKTLIIFRTKRDFNTTKKHFP